MASRNSFRADYRASYDTKAQPTYGYGVQGKGSSGRVDAALIHDEGFDRRAPPGFEVQIVQNSYIVSMRKVKDLLQGLFGNLPEIRTKYKLGLLMLQIPRPLGEKEFEWLEDTSDRPFITPSGRAIYPSRPPSENDSRDLPGANNKSPYTASVAPRAGDRTIAYTSHSGTAGRHGKR